MEIMKIKKNMNKKIKKKKNESSFISFLLFSLHVILQLPN